MSINIRKAEKEDLPEVLEMIKELAVYEKAPDEVTVTLEELREDGFGEKPVYEVYIAEEDRIVKGMAFFFYSYSTWKGKCIYLEDIIVKEQYRGKGIGEKLFDALIERCKQDNANRLMWQVLDWNTQAIEFYRKKYDAEVDAGWLNCKLTKKQIEGD